MEDEGVEPGRVPGRRIVVSGVIVVVVLSVLVAAVNWMPSVSASTAVEARQTPHRDLRIGVSGLTGVTLNPNAITLVLEFIPVYSVYSTLATRDAELRLAPDLARSWEVAPDDVTWTFHLVDNAFFTDPLNPTDRSHPVTADDVVFSYNMVKNNPGSILHSYATSLDRIEQVDTRTVRIVTLGPLAAMESTLTAIPIVPKYLWESIRDPVASAPRDYPVGSGALYWDATTSTLSGPLVLLRNPNWFGDAEYCQVPRPDEVRFILYTQSSSMIADFGSGTGTLDAIFNIPATSFLTSGDLQKEGISRMQVAGGFVGEIGINVMTDELRAALVDSGLHQFQTGRNNQILAKDQAVRHAIAMSIDRAAIIKYAYQGLATEGDTLIPASNPWHYDVPPEDEYPFDPAAARALLNEAGWTYDSAGNLRADATPLYNAAGDGLIFRLYTPDSHSEFEPAVSNMSRWLRQTGIVTTDERGNPVPGYEVKKVNQMNSIWKALDYDIWLWDWIFSRVSDPSVDILEVQTTDALGPTNDNGYSNLTYDDLYRESLVTVDPVARRAITDEMQRMLYDYAGYIIPYYADDLYAVTSLVQGARTFGWQNWGDWSTHPGLTVDSALAAPWLDVYPSDNPPPIITAFPDIEFVAGTSTTLSAIVSDPNDEDLTLTWDFGDLSEPQTTTGPTVDHTFAAPGTYTVTVRVEDSEWPVCATTTATIGAPTGNIPPVATLQVDFPVAGHGWEDEPLSFGVDVSDEEGDPLYITWDFGDEATATNYVTSTQTASTVTQTHAYAEDGNFTLRVTVSDNQTGFGHVQDLDATIPIWNRPPAAGGPGGPAGLDPLINFGVPLGILAIILIAAAAVFVTRRKARREEERREEEVERRPPPPPPSS